MQLKELIVKLKKYRKLIIFVAVLTGVLLIVLQIVDEKEEKTTLITPVIKTDSEKEEPIIKDPSKILTLEKVFPPSGGVSTVDKFTYIRFWFAENIDPEGINIYTDPYISLNLIVKDNSFAIHPDNQPWQDKRSYKITISGVRSLEGNKKAEEIIYIYYNEEPIIEDSGESGWLGPRD
jgi:hypothetical protein